MNGDSTSDSDNFSCGGNILYAVQFLNVFNSKVTKKRDHDFIHDLGDSMWRMIADEGLDGKALRNQAPYDTGESC